MKLVHKEQTNEVFIKHGMLIGEARRKVLREEHFDKMMFYLQCDMNLLVYGVGSKKHVIQEFLWERV